MATKNNKINRTMNRDHAISISNIPSEMKWQDLKDIMRKAGEVKYVDIFHSKEEASAKNGLIEFKDRHSALRAYHDFNGYRIDGRNLIIQLEKTHDDSKEQLMDVSNKPSLKNLTSSSSNCVVHVLNIPTNLNWTNLRDFFISAGDILRVDIVMSNRNVPMGVVVFKCPIDAIKAVVTFNGKYIGDSSIHVRLDTESSLYQTINKLGIDLYSSSSSSILDSLQEVVLSEQKNSHDSSETYGQYNRQDHKDEKFPSRRDRHESSRYRDRDRSPERRRRSPPHNKDRNPYPIPHHEAIELSREARKQRRQVYIKNLPYFYRSKDLNTKFSKAGNIVYADIITDRDGRSKGCGYVIYKSSDEAKAAAKIFDETDFDGRTVRVHVDDS